MHTEFQIPARHYFQCPVYSETFNLHTTATRSAPSSSTSFLNLILFYFWLCWVLVSVLGLSLVVVSGVCSPVAVPRLLIAVVSLVAEYSLQSVGSVVVTHGLSCSVARGLFPDQGLSPCPLHRQADSQPLDHQGSPILLILWIKTRRHRGIGKFAPVHPAGWSGPGFWHSLVQSLFSTPLPLYPRKQVF